MTRWTQKILSVGGVAFGGVLACILPAMAQPSAVAGAVIEGFIIPGYERIVQEAELQVLAMRALCTSPDQKRLEQAQAQFAALVQSWSRVDILRFGPVLEQDRLERILFWPDRKGAGLRQVQRALAEKDNSVLTLESLQAKSVAMQGLGALEFVLFGTGAQELTMDQGAFRCGYGQTIGEAIVDVADQLVDAWLSPNGIAAHLTAPDQSYADYRLQSEVLSELMGIWIHGSELMRETRIAPVLGDDVDSVKPRLGLFWRSNLTILSLKWSAEAMGDLLAISGFSDLLGEDDRWAVGSFAFELANFNRTAEELTGDGSEVLATTTGWGKLNYLMILSRSLQRIMTDEIAARLGVGAGFSALDGD